jgi:palmitoyltransferase
VCTINPCDRHLSDGAESNKDLLDTKQSLLVYCYICDKTVFKSSKHCKFCNKCVENFDHHCKWLNTCVGRANYRYFLLIVVGITIMTTLSIAISLTYVIESFAFTNEMKERISDSYIPMNILGVQIISVTSTVIFSPIVCLVLQLAGFHVRLLMNNMTTYEFIVNESKKRKLVREKKKNVEKKRAGRKEDSQTSNELVVGNKDEVDTEGTL